MTRLRTPKRLLIATTNSGKLREVAAILGDLPVELLTPVDFPGVPDAVEDGSTFEENARRKAVHYAQRTGHWALADDSGLEVDALHGDPGVYSARYAGAAAKDFDNNTKLIANLAGIPLEHRTARFRCVVALANPDGILATASGAFEGLIVDKPRGSNGFGYDPHFLLPDRGVTSAELEPAEKNKLSHRGQALRAILPQIKRLFDETP